MINKILYHIYKMLGRLQRAINKAAIKVDKARQTICYYDESEYEDDLFDSFEVQI